jgi:SAM-dependent methyltransferase
MSEKLEFTGERFTPECVREIWYEHVHRYAFARELVAGKRVLDAACGEGYGSALLATAAASVTGVDLAQASIEHARERYRAENLSFRSADCQALPFPDGAFDCVVSFETLEHLGDHAGLIREFRRVLKTDGFLLLSTPDKAVYSDRQQNRNEFHVRELYRHELEALLTGSFPACRLWGQKLLFHSAIWPLDGASGVGFQQERGGEIVAAAAPQHDPVYIIALCGAHEDCLPRPACGQSLFDDAAESVYEHYYHEIRKNMASGGLLAERDQEIAELHAELQVALGAAPRAAGPQRAWWRRLLGGR